jgi:hypothetical protein
MGHARYRLGVGQQSHDAHGRLRPGRCVRDLDDTAAAVAPENFLDANEEETAALINADLAAQADAPGSLQPAESLDVAKAEQASPDDLEVLETGATAGREDQPPLP